MEKITLCDFSIKLFMIGLGNFGGLIDLIISVRVCMSYDFV